MLIHWIKFVNRSDWKPTKNSVLCINHFEDKFIHYGKRNKLKWHLNPISTKYPTEALKRPSTLPTSAPLLRKAPKIRVPQNDELPDFNKKNVVFKFEDITEAHCPAGFQCFQDENQIIFYNIIFDHSTNFPAAAKAIKIDKSLRVELQYYSKPVSLPEWFTKGRNAKLTRFGMLENFQLYSQSFSEKEGSVCLLKKMMNHNFCSAKGRPTYSSEMIKFALRLRYTSAQLIKYY